MLAISNQINADIDKQQVLRNIGYSTACKPPARIESLINEYVEHTCQLIEPSYSYVIRDIRLVRGGSVAIDKDVTFQSQVIARLLEQCEKVAVFTLTIGHRLEEMVCSLSGDDLIVQAAVLDAIGSEAVETVAGFVQDEINKVVRAEGLCTSPRFSPGYCDWDVSQQEVVFRAMNGDSAKICLTKGFLMLPRKSMSGIIGIDPANSDIENYNPCKTCDKSECPGRR